MEVKSPIKRVVKPLRTPKKMQLPKPAKPTSLIRKALSRKSY